MSSDILDALQAINVGNQIANALTSEKTPDAKRGAIEGVYSNTPLAPGQMVNARGTVFGGTTFDQRQKAVEIQNQVRDMINRGKIAHSMPGAIGIGLGMLSDKQIADFEEENATARPTNPLSAQARSRFSPLGQIVAGYGYVQQPGLVMPNLLTRAIDYALGRDQQIPAGSLFNARGNVMTAGRAPATNTGFETVFGGSGGDNDPNDGMTSFGGMESAVGHADVSGYA